MNFEALFYILKRLLPAVCYGVCWAFISYSLGKVYPVLTSILVGSIVFLQIASQALIKIDKELRALELKILMEKTKQKLKEANESRL